MAMPSLVTLGGLAFVLVAGGGLVGVSADAVLPGASQPSAPDSTTHRAQHPPTATARTVRPQTLHERKSPRAHPDAVPQVLVEVYNNSGITGLAAQKASRLEGAGWNVASTDNWYGDIPANTVYYPPQLRPAAQRLAKTLAVTRVLPAVAPMQFDRLTVIFTTG